MRKVFVILTLCVGMVDCSDGKTRSVAENQQNKKDVVEVLYFHGAQRCATCMAIEKNTKALIEKAYAERYEVNWSALILVDYDKNGKEGATNLTKFAFGNAAPLPTSSSRVCRSG